jgi:uncharacterized protein (DUF4415 family)
MESKMVSYTVEGSLPSISDEAFEELRRSADRPDGEIDYSDIPEITLAQARHFFPGVLRRFFRTHLMTKVDGDILAWLRAKGVDHDLFINDLLRREMDKEQSKEKQAA